MKKIIIQLFFLLIATASFAQEVTEVEAIAFAKKLQTAIENKDKTFFGDNLNMKNFCANAKANNEEATFLKDVFDQVDLGAKIVEVIKNEGSYEFVKQFSKDNKRYILFRLFTADYTINYHELELCKVKNNIEISDIYVYISGEKFSETLIELYRTFVADNNKLQMSDKARYKALAATVPKMRALKAEGKFEEALKMYNALPAEFKSNKSLMLIKITITQNLDEAGYLKDIEAYTKVNPNADHLALVMIDAYTIKKQYDKALNCIDQLDASINTDPFLDFYRYLFNNLNAQPDKALSYLEKACAQLPNMELIQLELIMNYKELEKKESLEKLVKTYQANANFNQDKLAAILE